MHNVARAASFMKCLWENPNSLSFPSSRGLWLSLTHSCPLSFKASKAEPPWSFTAVPPSDTPSPSGIPPPPPHPRHHRSWAYQEQLLCAPLCQTLCSPMDCSPLGISQARILEWVAISSSRGSFWPRDRTCISYVSCIGGWILYHWEACRFFPCDEIGPKWILLAISPSYHPSP